MKYYFGTTEQVNGDKAYNKQNFQAALAFYKKGLNNLRITLGQKEYKPSAIIYDELASALSAVALAQADAIRAKIGEGFDYLQIEDQLNEIPALLDEMSKIYDQIHSRPRIITQKKHIQEAFKAAAICYEEISDAIIDGMIAKQDGPKLEDESKVLHALKYLKIAIQYYQKASEPMESSRYIGCLSIMELAYKANPSNKQMLDEMKAYIDENQLFKLKLEVMEILEIKSSLLFIALEKNDKEQAEKLKQECLELMKDSDEIDQESFLIQNLHELFEKVQATALTPQLLQLFDVVESEWNSMAAAAEESKSSEVTMMELDDEPRKRSNSATEETEPHSHSKMKRVRFFLDEPVRKDEAIEFPKSYGEIFTKALTGMAKHFPDPKFLANIISLVGDFYRKSHSLPFKNIPILAYQLYEQTLCLDPAHEVAKAQKQNIYTCSPANQKMIDDNKRVAATPIVSLDSPESMIHFFDVIVEEHVLQIETLSLTKSDRLGEFFKQLVDFLACNILTKRIGGHFSEHISQTMKKHFDEMCQHLVEDEKKQNKHCLL